MNSRDIKLRVDRERAAHGESDDVLARAYALKRRFHHITKTPGYLRMEQLESGLVKRMTAKRVLDYGCGCGDKAIEYLSFGIESVVGIDISEKYIASARNRCAKLGIDPQRAQFIAMDAHELSLPDAEFDLVIGRGILHHLDLKTALPEIRRVLRPGGTACFLEPLAGNPLLKLFRRITPRARTVDERPLTSADLTMISEQFVNDSYYFGLLSAPVAALTSIVLPAYPSNPFIKVAHFAESSIRSANFLNSWHQYVLLKLTRPNN